MIERNCKPAHSRGKKSLLAALIAGCVAAGPATAGTIGINGSGTLVIGAEPLDSGVTLTAFTEPAPNPTLFSLIDPDGIFDLVTPGCSGGPIVPNGPNLFSCLLSGFTSILVIGSTGDDVFEFSGVLGIGATFAGGDGDDNITGTSAADTIFAGAGDDLLFGAGAIDSYFADVSEVPFLELGESIQADFDPGFDPLPRPPLAVPEPGSVLLLLAGLGAIAATKFRGQRRTPRYC
jgi:hypothetical protein